jgi:uncharacterized protein (TIGR02284 family)
METVANEPAIKALGKLITVNNDRIEGYKKAIRECKQTYQDLIAVFNKMIDTSVENKTELEVLVSELGGTAPSTSVMEKIYWIWMDAEEINDRSDRQSLLAYCERGEDEVKKAYEEVLSAHDLQDHIYDIVEDQYQRTASDHKRIKFLRERAKVFGSGM